MYKICKIAHEKTCNREKTFKDTQGYRYLLSVACSNNISILLHFQADQDIDYFQKKLRGCVTMTTPSCQSKG